MDFKITTVVENTVPKARGLIGEHGISFMIEAGHRKVLFDTGQGFALTKNAKTLGIDLATVDAVVLSHGHYDHTGGLEAMLALNRRFTLYSHPDAFAEKFAKRNGQVHPIGLSLTQQALEERGIRLVMDRNPMEIVPGIKTSGEIPMETSYETIDPALFVMQGGTLVPDPLKDDLSLILCAKNGSAVLLGCAHRGVINILRHAGKMCAASRLLAIAGGLHLGAASGEIMNRIVTDLKGFAPELIVPGHCSGFNAVLTLCNAFGEKVRPNQVGSVIEI